MKVTLIQLHRQTTFPNKTTSSLAKLINMILQNTWWNCSTGEGKYHLTELRMSWDRHKRIIRILWVVLFYCQQTYIQRNLHKRYTGIFIPADSDENFEIYRIFPSIGSLNLRLMMKSWKEKANFFKIRTLRFIFKLEKLVCREHLKKPFDVHHLAGWLPSNDLISREFYIQDYSAFNIWPRDQFCASTGRMEVTLGISLGSTLSFFVWSL